MEIIIIILVLLGILYRLSKMSNKKEETKVIYVVDKRPQPGTLLKKVRSHSSNDGIQKLPKRE